MKLEWMGEYRDFVEKMIKYGNAYATRCQKEHYFGSEILFSPSQLQTMEYILESEDQHQSMVEIAARLGVSPATFSRNVKRMVEKGLLEKYHLEGNRKTVIVKVSPLGRKTYEDYSRFVIKYRFQRLFDMLDEIPPQWREKMANVIDAWASYVPQPQNAEEERTWDSRPRDAEEKPNLIRIE